MTKIKDKTVLVTGGASGIGKMLGEKCLKEGASSLVIWDIHKQNLAMVAEELREKGYTVHAYLVDVSSLDDIRRAATLTLSEVGAIDILFNNAGIIVGKSFTEHTHEDIERTIRINVLGVMHVARVFGAEMVRKGSGHIVNIASAAGLVPNPKMSVYAGSKWAVLGFSESIRLEFEALNDELKFDLHVTTVTPSYIDTGMFTGVKAPLLAPLLKPEDITDDILEAVRNNDIILRAPWSVYLIPVLRGILPARVFDMVVGYGLNIYSSMTSFVGRTTQEAVSKEKPNSVKVN